jgi:GntR family negative regulator for fad regulon and positive regulator of fabA
MTTYQTNSNQIGWASIPKPAELTEKRLIEAILNNTFPIDSNLPGERELANALGVTRPTLREALQRLERDGWLEIHQGKPTRVRDYWKEGRMGVLNSLSEHLNALPRNFISDLLAVRLAMAPMYVSLAVKFSPDQVLDFLRGRLELEDSPQKYARFDWELHHTMTILSGNPVFVMILNSFKDLYLTLAPHYFSTSSSRQRSFTFYQELAGIAKKRDIDLAKTCTESVMKDSIEFWGQIDFI